MSIVARKANTGLAGTPAAPGNGAALVHTNVVRRILGAVERSLKLKFTLIIVGVLALTVGVAPWGAIKMQEAQLLEASAQRLEALERMVATITSMYMLSEERHSVQQKLEATRDHQDIYRLRILTPDGVVAFSSHREEVGGRISNEELSQYIGRPEPLVRKTAGGITHTLIRPLFNQPGCHSCHDAQKKVLGIIQVTLSLSDISQRIASLRESALVATLITLAVVSLGIWLSLSFLIDRPLQRLVEVMERVAGGDLSAQALVTSNDEIGQLAFRLNHMISELRAAQERLNAYHKEQLARADRLATIGEMAAAIAHEIRNPLTGIRGVLSVLSRDFPEDDARRGIIRQTNQLVDRLSKSVDDILHYSRPSPPRLQSVHLSEIVTPVVSLLSGEARKAGVALITETASVDGSRKANVDPHQIQQVLVNLILNALQATPAGGEVHIRATSSSVEGQQQIVLEIEDNGKGMNPGEVEKAFHPFFSTKAHGTGLGLAIAKQVVERHAGRISLSSTLGKGTLVRVEIPAGHATPNPGA